MKCLSKDGSILMAQQTRHASHESLVPNQCSAKEERKKDLGHFNL
jgi:hypothetical protein